MDERVRRREPPRVERERMLIQPWRIARFAYQARRDQAQGHEAILRRRAERLQAMVDHARTWSRAYADLYADVPERIHDVTQLPTTTKAQLMEGFDDRVTDPAVTLTGVSTFTSDASRLGSLYLGRYFACTTSGVTGRRAILLKDAPEIGGLSGLRAARLLPTILRATSGRVPGGRTAVIVATGGHYAGAAGVEFARQHIPFMEDAVRTFSVLAPVHALVRELNAFRPRTLVGYPTAIRLLADEARAGRLHIRPALTITAGEMLSGGDRAAIEDALGGAVHPIYAASEALGIAFECAEGALHVNEDQVILEAVDHDLEPVAPGRASHTTLLTNLTNHVQPILRYDLGDSITLDAEPCACGSPLTIVRVEGRRDDVLEFAGGTRILPLALASVIEETPGVARFQAIQRGADKLRIRLAPVPGRTRDEVWPEVETRVRALLEAHGARDAALTLDPKPPQRDARSGKYRHVWRETRAESAAVEATTR